MPESSLAVRPIEARDWDSVFEIFRAVVTEGETYAYPEDLTSDTARALWVEGRPGATVVALRDDVILGTAKFGPNRPARGAHVATASFMVVAEARGKGSRSSDVRVRHCVGEGEGLRRHAIQRGGFDEPSRHRALPETGIRHHWHGAGGVRTRHARSRRTRHHEPTTLRTGRA